MKRFWILDTGYWISLRTLRLFALLLCALCVNIFVVSASAQVSPYIRTYGTVSDGDIPVYHGNDGKGLRSSGETNVTAYYTSLQGTIAGITNAANSNAVQDAATSNSLAAAIALRATEAQRILDSNSLAAAIAAIPAAVAVDTNALIGADSTNAANNLATSNTLAAEVAARIAADTNKVSKMGDTMYGGLVGTTASFSRVNGTVYGSNVTAITITGGQSVELGVQANATNMGVAVGGLAQGGSEGVGIGWNAYGQEVGVAIGSQATAYNDGVAVGGYSKGSQRGVGVGKFATAHTSGVAVGWTAVGNKSGVAVGYAANGENTNVAIGVFALAAGGSERIALGHNVTNAVDNSAAIRGTLYLDGATGILYRTTFGTGAWTELFSDLADNDYATNYELRTTALSTNNAQSARIVSVEGYTSRVVAVEGFTNRSAAGLASSVWASAISTTGYMDRVTQNATNSGFQTQLDGKVSSVALLPSMTIANRSGLSTNLSGFTAAYTGALGTVITYTGAVEWIIGKSYSVALGLSGTYLGTSWLSIGSASDVRYTNSAVGTMVSNYFRASSSTSLMYLTISSVAGMAQIVTNVYVKEITSGDLVVADNVWVGGEIKTPTFSDTNVVRRSGDTMTGTLVNNHLISGNGNGITNIVKARFLERGDGTVEDGDTGLVWMRDANSGGLIDYTNAVLYVGLINSNAYLGFSDWRLPNVNMGANGYPEFESIGRVGGCSTGTWTAPSVLFQNVSVEVGSDYYWAESTGVDPGWVLRLRDGTPTIRPKGLAARAWVVRGGLPITKTDFAIATKNIDLNGHTIIDGSYSGNASGLTNPPASWTTDTGATGITAGATDSYDPATKTLTWNTNAAGGGTGTLTTNSFSSGDGTVSITSTGGVVDFSAPSAAAANLAPLSNSVIAVGLAATNAGTQASAPNGAAVTNVPAAWTTDTGITNYLAVESASNFVSLSTATLLQGCVTNGGAGMDASDASNQFVNVGGDTLLGPLNWLIDGTINLGGATNISIGIAATSTVGGVAIGRIANATGKGVAIGFGANGGSFGVAVGEGANAYNYGTAVGQSASAASEGAAFGDGNRATGKGTALGGYSYALDGAVGVGYGTRAYDSAIRIGYDIASATPLCGTNIAIGFKTSCGPAAGGGSAGQTTNTIALGNFLTNTINNSIRVRGDLYLDGGTNVVNYRPTFGTGAFTPATMLVITNVYTGGVMRLSTDNGNTWKYE